MSNKGSSDNDERRHDVILRWELRESLRLNNQQAQKEVAVSLFYSELSIGPVLAISIAGNLPTTFPAFCSVKLPRLTAAYVQHVLIWWLTLRDNPNLGESGIYNNLHDEEKIAGIWNPHSSFLVAGEATAIETKLQLRKFVNMDSNSLFRESSKFLNPLGNNPTRKLYVSRDNLGKRGKFDPGPVFGTSWSFLESEANLQKFFNE